MLNLYTTSIKRETIENGLTNQEKLSLKYHDLFDYPLSFADLIKWKTKESNISNESKISITSKSGFYFLDGREGLIYKTLLRKRISVKKMKIARRASKILKFIPTVKMIAVTGSLAMENSAEDSDIDLMVITKSGTLWTTRLFGYLVIWLFGIQKRKPFDRHQKDKLCLNMWLDENDLVWEKKDRNLYTAHEIAQIVPLVNKNKTYENFLRCNRWILDFWPSAVKILSNKDIKILSEKTEKHSVSLYLLHFISPVVEKLAYQLQKNYMKKKITRETITKTRALFHPQDWGEVVLKRLST